LPPASNAAEKGSFTMRFMNSRSQEFKKPNARKEKPADLRSK
jgi:hypothetical protein